MMQYSLDVTLHRYCEASKVDLPARLLRRAETSQIGTSGVPALGQEIRDSAATTFGI